MRWPRTKLAEPLKALPDLEALEEVMVRVAKLHSAIDGIMKEMDTLQEKTADCAAKLNEPLIVPVLVPEQTVIVAQHWYWSTIHWDRNSMLCDTRWKLFSTSRGSMGQGHRYRLSLAETNLREGLAIAKSGYSQAKTITGIVLSVFAPPQVIDHVIKHMIFCLGTNEQEKLELPPLEAWLSYEISGGKAFQMSYANDPITTKPLACVMLDWGTNMPDLVSDLDIRVSLAFQERDKADRS